MVQIRKVGFICYSLGTLFCLFLKIQAVDIPHRLYTEQDDFWCLPLLLPGHSIGGVGNFFTDICLQFFGFLSELHKREIIKNPKKIEKLGDQNITTATQ